MYIRSGRFAWLYVAAVFVCVGASGCAVWLSISHLETELPVSPDLFVNSIYASTKKQGLSEALTLKAYPLTDDATHLNLSIFASKMLARPDCLKAPKAVRLYTEYPNEEHSARLGKRLYLKRKEGRFCFAEPGEKTSIWVIPETKKNAALLFAEMDVDGKVEKLGQFQVPLIEGGAWPKEGICIEGICIDESMFKRLGVKWSGVDLLQSPDCYQLFFKAHSLKISNKDWMVIKDGKWQVANVKDSTATKPLMRLYAAEKNQLIFEVIDSDGQLHLLLPLSKTDDSIEDHVIDDFGPVAFRTLEKIAVKVKDVWQFFSLGDALVYREGVWKKVDLKNPPLGPLLVLSRIESMPLNPYLVVTLYSAMHSKSRTIKLPIERLKRKAV